MGLAGGHFIHDDGKRPQVTRGLLLRVLGYARPYTPQIALLLFLIFLTSVLGLITPLIFRDLIDYTLPQGDIVRLNLFALALIALPVIRRVLRVFQRQLNSGIGEGLIYDLRVALYTHLQKMSLRFFTNTKTGELMSRLNSDVVDAQSAVNDTIVGIITNVVSVVMTLIVMIAMDWHLTVLGLAVLPLFVFAARRIGTILRKYARDQMRYNAQMNAMMNETLNISGAILVKLFGRSKQEVSRFDDRAGKVRDIGVSRAVVGGTFFCGHRLD